MNLFIINNIRLTCIIEKHSTLYGDDDSIQFIHVTSWHNHSIYLLYHFLDSLIQ